MENKNKYHNGKIYKIVDIGYNKCYIGSTTEELSMRIARHRSNFKRFLNIGKKFVSSFELFNEYGIENCKIEFIEYYKCDTLQELQRKEGEHIKNTEGVNKRVAGRTYKEYYVDNKDKRLEQSKECREANKDKMQEYQKEYYKNNKDKIKELQKEYKQDNKNKIKEFQKEWYEQNKQKIKEYKKKYYEKHQEKIKEWQRESYKLKKI